jgi:hypothetical protein
MVLLLETTHSSMSLSGLLIALALVTAGSVALLHKRARSPLPVRQEATAAVDTPQVETR